MATSAVYCQREVASARAAAADARREEEAHAAEHAELEAELEGVREEIADARHAAEYEPQLTECLPASLRENPKGWEQGAVGLNSLRGVVSKKKRRFQRDGFDLDLSYITPQLLAMGFPSSGSEARFRNPMQQVQAFFQTYHRGCYKVYNLCCERGYPASQFEAAAAYPFMDHNPPPMLVLIDCVEDIYRFTDADPRNVAAIHCKAGKGRTGLVVCCCLVRCGEHLDAEQAMRYYGIVRTSNAKGVTIQSQQRYISYFAELVKFAVPRGVLEAPASRTLVGFRIHTTPKGGCQGLFVKVEQDIQCTRMHPALNFSAGDGISADAAAVTGVGKKKSNKWKSTSHQGNSRRSWREDPGFVLDVRADLRVRGDILVQIYDKRPMLQKSKKLMHVWQTLPPFPIMLHLTQWCQTVPTVLVSHVFRTGQLHVLRERRDRRRIQRPCAPSLLFGPASRAIFQLRR